MRIFVQGVRLKGQYILPDPCLDALASRHGSAKRTYFSTSFGEDDYNRADCFIINKEHELDWLLDDMEKLERNIYTDMKYTELINRALKVLEEGHGLNGTEFTPAEFVHLKGLNLFTIKPGIVVHASLLGEEIEEIVRCLHRRIGLIFFYTAGRTEARVWEVSEGAGIATAAGRIHSDLERGFIRAEVYNVSHLDEFQTSQEARVKGILKVVDRSHQMVAGDVIDIRFNV